jgi:hypothetical protein
MVIGCGGIKACKGQLAMDDLEKKSLLKSIEEIRALLLSLKPVSTNGPGLGGKKRVMHFF